MYYYNENIEKVILSVWSYTYKDGISETLLDLVNRYNDFHLEYNPEENPQIFTEERYLRKEASLHKVDYLPFVMEEEFKLPFELKYGDVISYDVLIPLTDHAKELKEALGLEQAYFVSFGNRYLGTGKEGKQIIQVRLEMIQEDFLGENEMNLIEKIREYV